MTFLEREGIFKVREKRSLKKKVILFEKGKPRATWGRKIMHPLTEEVDGPADCRNKKFLIQAICLDFFLKNYKVPGTLSLKGEKMKAIRAKVRNTEIEMADMRCFYIDAIFCCVDCQDYHCLTVRLGPLDCERYLLAYSKIFKYLQASEEEITPQGFKSLLVNINSI